MSNKKKQESHKLQQTGGGSNAMTGQNGSENVQLIVLLYDSKLAAWLQLSSGLPQPVRIKGESCLVLRDVTSLSSAYEDLLERLRGDDRAPHRVAWVADEKGREWIANKRLSTWQLPWEWLADRFNVVDGNPWDHVGVLEALIWPWLLVTQESALGDLQVEHDAQAAQLAAQRSLLVQENNRLRAINAEQQPPSAELLVSLLPALYPRIFTVIGPADLSLLCGRVEPIALPSPYPEPVDETLRVLQKRFRALTPDLQMQVVGFVSDLPQCARLQPRHEMQELVEDLKGGEHGK